MMKWMAVWTTEVLNKCRKRSDDGRTAYELMTGHVCRHPKLDIWETVMFMVVMDKTHRHKADTDWCEGLF